MLEDFQQTVDLRDRAEKRRQPVRPSGGSSKPAATPLGKIYEPEEPNQPKKDYQKISRPARSQPRDGLIRTIVFILAILVVGAMVYWLFFKEKKPGPETLKRDWYAVKLVDGEIFYGQIADVKADPVVIANVYYNYDQAKQAEAGDKSKIIAETGNIRLVKRGKETHGPDGSMNVVRAQVLYMEALKPDSKVLKAILEYEK